MLPKTSAYVKSFDGQTKWMYFLIGDDGLLEKHDFISDKVDTDIKKDSEPVYNKRFLKAKIKSYVNEAIGFYDKQMPKARTVYTCLAVINVDSALKKDENCYPQVFLKERKYIEKVIRHIIEDPKISSDESDESD